jgi:hypothetical protein
MLLCGILDHIKSNSPDSVSYVTASEIQLKQSRQFWDQLLQLTKDTKSKKQKVTIWGGAEGWIYIHDVAGNLLRDTDGTLPKKQR